MKGHESRYEWSAILPAPAFVAQSRPLPPPHRPADASPGVSSPARHQFHGNFVPQAGPPSPAGCEVVVGPNVPKRRHEFQSVGGAAPFDSAAILSHPAKRASLERGAPESPEFSRTQSFQRLHQLPAPSVAAGAGSELATALPRPRCSDLLEGTFAARGNDLSAIMTKKPRGGDGGGGEGREHPRNGGGASVDALPWHQRFPPLRLGDLLHPRPERYHLLSMILKYQPSTLPQPPSVARAAHSAARSSAGADTAQQRPCRVLIVSGPVGCGKQTLVTALAAAEKWTVVVHHLDQVMAYHTAFDTVDTGGGRDHRPFSAASLVGRASLVANVADAISLGGDRALHLLLDADAMLTEGYLRAYLGDILLLPRVATHRHPVVLLVTSMQAKTLRDLEKMPGVGHMKIFAPTISSMTTRARTILRSLPPAPVSSPVSSFGSIFTPFPGTSLRPGSGPPASKGWGEGPDRGWSEADLSSLASECQPDFRQMLIRLQFPPGNTAVTDQEGNIWTVTTRLMRGGLKVPGTLQRVLEADIALYIALVMENLPGTVSALSSHLDEEQRSLLGHNLGALELASLMDLLPPFDRDAERATLLVVWARSRALPSFGDRVRYPTRMRASSSASPLPSSFPSSPSFSSFSASSSSSSSYSPASSHSSFSSASSFSSPSAGAPSSSWSSLHGASQPSSERGVAHGGGRGAPLDEEGTLPQVLLALNALVHRRSAGSRRSDFSHRAASGGPPLDRDL